MPRVLYSASVRPHEAPVIKLVSVACLAAISGSAVAASGIAPLIVGGSEVRNGSKTYVVGLRETAKGVNYCGGSLITPTHVLTTVHCTGSAYVSIGSHYLSGALDGERIKVVKETHHPSYDPLDHYTFDFAILELATASVHPPVVLGTETDLRLASTVTTLG